MSEKNDSTSKQEFNVNETNETVKKFGSNGKIQNKNTDNTANRHRILHTFCIFTSIFAMGWRNALIGPTLPDIRIIIDENLATASWIFTANSLGGLLGAI